MKLFSEKVEPTFTSSNLNILGVKNFKEIFIDVFEFEINGKKFVAEKVSDHKGLPVVNIPIVLRGNEYTAPFVLRRGEIEVLFNENNATFVRPVLEEVQELIEQHTDGEKEKVYSFIKTTVEESANKLSSDIENKTKHIEGLVNEKIINLTTNTIPNIFLKSMRDSSNANLIDLKEQLESIGAEVKDVKAEKENIYNDLKDLAEGTLHLSENVDKNINKALSRVGNIRATLETSIESAVNNLNKKIEDVEANIERYYSEKIDSITSEVHEITEQNKESLIELIESSKQALLQEISSIKDNVPNIVIENADGKQEVDIKGIKTELEKIIGTKFTTEIAALRRLIELSSGGGSVAKQFANGGTMDGTLNVTGKYLSGGVDLLDIFTGGGGSDDIYVSTLVRASSANWDNAYNTGTVYQSNSAAYATIDFTNSKFFSLTGGTITGETRINNNLTVFGNLTATGTTTFANTVFSVTSSLSVVHVGSGPALWVGNNGDGDIASFYDIDQGVEILHVGGINSTYPNVGIRTSVPNKELTVVGEISSTSDVTTSGKFYIQGDGGSDQWQSTYATVQSNSATNWSYQGTDLKALSGNWESTYTLTNNNSANWDNVYTNVSSNSANYILNGGNDVLSTLVIGTNTDQDLVFETNGTTKMIITSGGNIGIGTLTPAVTFEVNGTAIIQDDTIFNGTENTIPYQTLDGGDGSIITKAIGDVRYLDKSPVTSNTLSHTIEQFEDFDKQYDSSSIGGTIFAAAASGSFTPGTSHLFGNYIENTFSDNDRYTWNGAMLIRGPTASNQVMYLGLARCLNSDGTFGSETTFRLMLLSAGTSTGYFKIGPIPWGGTGGGDAALNGGIMYNPVLFGNTNLHIAVRSSGSLTPFTFTTTLSNVNYVDTGFDFNPYRSKWINITYRHTVVDGHTVLRIIIKRDSVILYDSNNLFVLRDQPYVSWPNRFALYSSGASRKIGIQLGNFTYTARQSLYIDYIHEKVFKGTSWSPPSNWNELRF